MYTVYQKKKKGGGGLYTDLAMHDQGDHTKDWPAGPIDIDQQRTWLFRAHAWYIHTVLTMFKWLAFLGERVG